jgi:hypothetical protein
MIIPCIESRAKTANSPAMVVHVFFDEHMRRTTQYIGTFESTLRDNNMDAYISGKALAVHHSVAFVNKAI